MLKPKFPLNLPAERFNAEVKAGAKAKYKPIERAVWDVFKALEAVGTQALHEQSGRSGVSFTTRVKFDWEMRRNGLRFPQTSPNIGPHGIISIDTYAATMELVSDGYYTMEWRRLLEPEALSSYSNVEYASYRSRMIYPTGKVEELRRMLDSKGFQTENFIRGIKILATRLGLDPLGLARRSKSALIEIVKSGHMPYSHFGNCGEKNQCRLTDIMNHAGDITGGRIRGNISVNFRHLEPNEVDKCREACLSIIEHKEDPIRKPCIFVSELIWRWKHGDHSSAGNQVLFAGRFVRIPSLATDPLVADFSTSLYLKGEKLECTVYLHQAGFDSSKLSPLRLTESVFLMLGTVNGNTDSQNRPIITANALIPVEELQQYVPRFPAKTPTITPRELIGGGRKV
jgi:hypothetical protein